MTEQRVLLDPTPETTPMRRQRITPPKSLHDVTLGLLDISKARGNVLLDRLAAQFAERGIEMKRYTKPTFSKPLPVDLAQTIATECDVVVEALAD